MDIAVKAVLLLYASGRVQSRLRLKDKPIAMNIEDLKHKSKCRGYELSDGKSISLKSVDNAPPQNHNDVFI